MRVLKEKMIAVIEAEQKLIQFNLVGGCEEPGHCAIGALAFAAGVDADYLSRVKDSSTDGVLRDVLREHYGFSQGWVRRLTRVNDAVDYDAEQRRARVLDFIRSLPDEAEDEVQDEFAA